MDIDDIMNPAYAESRRASVRAIMCEHAIAIIDEHLARLRAGRTGDDPGAREREPDATGSAVPA